MLLNVCRVVTVFSALVFVSACSYQAPTNVAPAYNVFSNYTDKISGRYALTVEAEEMDDTIKVSGFTCSAHNYPLQAQSQFISSTRLTLEQLFESIEVVDEASASNILNSGMYDGLVRVMVDDLDVDLTVIPGFWTATMEADVEITASYTLDRADGRVLGGSVEGDKDFESDSGGACEGGAIAIGQAVEGAMKEATKLIGERLSSSPKLREKAEPTS